MKFGNSTCDFMSRFREAETCPDGKAFVFVQPVPIREFCAKVLELLPRMFLLVIVQPQSHAHHLLQTADHVLQLYNQGQRVINILGVTL